MTEPPVLEIVIPLVEFERLHAEVARLEGLVERRDAEIVRLGNAWDKSLADLAQATREMFKFPVTYGGTETLAEMIERAQDEFAKRTLALSESQAELAQARAETDDLVSKAWAAATAGFDELRAENEKLRAALALTEQKLVAMKTTSD